MTPNEWAGLAVAATTLVAALAITVRHLVKYYLSELKQNGGSSLRDKVDINTDRLSRVENRVDQIYLMLSEK